MTLDFLISARQTAAQALAAIAADLFPGALLIQGSGTRKIFFYDFIFPGPFQPKMLDMLEEGLRLKLKATPEIRMREMMVKNAALLLKHQGQRLRAEQLLDRASGVVSMVEIDGFVDWSTAPFEEEWDSRLQVKLLQALPIQLSQGDVGRSGVRVIGVLGKDKQELKESIKQMPDFAKCRHEPICQQFKLCAEVPSLGEGLWGWLPRGESLKGDWISWWQKEHAKQNFHFVSTPASLIDAADPLLLAHTDLFISSGLSRVAEIAYLPRPLETSVREGLLDLAGGICDRAHLFCREEEVLQECISSLHFITKIPKILGFEFRILLSGAQKKRAKGVTLFRQALEKGGFNYAFEDSSALDESEVRITVRLVDVLGREWDGPFLSLHPMPQRQRGVVLLQRSTFGSLERWIALVLEKNQGREIDEPMNALNWSRDSEPEN